MGKKKKKRIEILIGVFSILIILLGGFFFYKLKPITGFILLVVGGILYIFKKDLSKVFGRR